MLPRNHAGNRASATRRSFIPIRTQQTSARVARIPGSINMQEQRNGDVSGPRRAGDDSICYTMQQLGRLLRVCRSWRSPCDASAQAGVTETSEKRKQARLIGLRRRRDQLVQLIGMRVAVLP